MDDDHIEMIKLKGALQGLEQEAGRVALMMSGDTCDKFMSEIAKEILKVKMQMRLIDGESKDDFIAMISGNKNGNH